MTATTTLQEPGPARMPLAGPATRWAPWSGRLAFILLVLGPVVAFLVPTLLGGVPISGDNPVQAFPERVLAARIISDGHLPLWDPYLWSGTPLLAGFSAGALYPATFLFMGLPAVWAWAVTEMLVYIVSDLGMYAFLRGTRRSVGASVLGAMSWSFAGVMVAQVGHIDLVEGMAMAPWMMLALHRLAEGPGPGAGRWSALLGASFALVILAGAPEAMIDLAILAAVVAVVTAAGGGAERPWRYLGMALAGMVGGVAVGAIQWLPGIDFAFHSQRAAISYAFFASGSLPPKLTGLFVLPYWLGGYGTHGLPPYTGPYNLAELSGYVGLLPLVAAAALLLRRRRPGEPPLLAWYAAVAVGLVLSYGSYTPLGHLLYHVPVYGQQRTQSRNLMDVDMGLSVLLAVWVDRVRGARPSSWWRDGTGTWTLASFLPLAAVGAALGVTHLGGDLEAAVAGPSHAPAGASPGIGWYLVAALVLALAAAVVGVGVPHWPRRWRFPPLLALVAADLGVFVAGSYAFVPSTSAILSSTTPGATRLAAATGPTARFGIYGDTLQRFFEQYRLGGPDLNIVDRVHSVSGYGPVVGGAYADATGTHGSPGLVAPGLAGSTYDLLDMRILVAPAAAFSVPLRPGQAPSAAAYRTVAPKARSAWLMGSVRTVRSVSVAGRHLRVGLLEPSGRVAWGARSARAVGVVVDNVGAATARVPAPVVALAGGRRLWLNGALSGSVEPPHWGWAGSAAGFGLYRDARARGQVWVAGPGRARVVSQAEWGREVDQVVTRRPGLLVRSVADAPGWTATVHPAGGRPYTLPARRHGLVQAVPVPAGTSYVTWTYRPRSVIAGGVVTLVGLAGGGVLLGMSALRRRRRPATLPAP